MSVIFLIIAFAILILSHEFGHFIVAKKIGMKVDEFGLGFPPRLFKIKKGGTVYSFNAIPFGGFVKIPGEDGEKGLERVEGAFSSKSVGLRSLVIIAGVAFNVILAWFLISFSFIIGAPVSSSAVPPGGVLEETKIVIVQVVKGSPAELSGLKPGDKLIAFSQVEDARNFINKNIGKEIELRYQRGKVFSSAVLTPRINPPEGEGAIGIAMDEIGILKLPFYKSVWEGTKTTYNLTVGTTVAFFTFIVEAIKGRSVLDAVAGPIGIIGLTGDAAKLGFVYLLNFIAFLSINLAILNILPFPALDGGRLVFLLVEKIKGSPVSSKFTGITHSVGMVILMFFMLLVTYHDIVRLVF